MWYYFFICLNTHNTFHRTYLYIVFESCMIVGENSIDVTFRSTPLLKKSPVPVNTKINTSSFLADSFKSFVSSWKICKRLIIKSNIYIYNLYYTLYIYIYIIHYILIDLRFFIYLFTDSEIAFFLMGRLITTFWILFSTVLNINEFLSAIITCFEAI